MVFTHYTSEIATVRNILTNGFAWIPNKRDLITNLLPFHDFKEREPQQFGMISFTDLPPEAAHGVRTKFGNYGIVISQGWASSNNIQKVNYVDTNRRKRGRSCRACLTSIRIGSKLIPCLDRHA